MAELETSQIPTRLWAQFRRQAPRYGVGLVLLGLYQAVQYGFDTQLRRAVNTALLGESSRTASVGWLLVFLACAAFLIRVVSRVTIFNAGRIAEYELRRALLGRLQKLGPAFYRRMSVGEIMSRVTNDLTQLRLLLGFCVLNVINTPFALVSALTFTLSISVKLTLASLTTLPLLLLVMRFYGKAMFTRVRENQDALGKISELVQTSIAGVRVVKSFALENHEAARFEAVNQAYLARNLGLAQLRGILGPLMYATVGCSFLIVFWYGGHLLLSGDIDAGGFIAFFRAMSRLAWPLISLGFLVAMVQRGRAAYSRLREIYDAEPEIVDGVLPPESANPGRLEVRGLTFGYGERRVLQDVSFVLEPGRSVAIVGRTGSGKSTLAVLLPRLQPTPPGTVFLDGRDICGLPLETVRRTIGYTQQTAFLFSTTVGRNIGYVLDDPDHEPATLTIRRAAAEARVLDELLGLPDGLDTVVGERGVQLSGGQKQRVALARSFVAAPPILVLDDPLSAVDTETEQKILESIDRQRAERSVILITHRVSAASHCDRVLVLEQGQVVERGTHEELLRQGGIYARFAEEQRIELELSRLGSDDLVPSRAEATQGQRVGA